ncbi:MAG: EF-hand domain-containing protein [Planctomycetales bacterium]
MNLKPFLHCGLLGLSVACVTPSWGEETSPIDAQKVFAEFDKNKDGKIEPDEVPAEKKKFFDRLLRLGDKNKDGILAKEEFGTATKEPEAPKGELRGFDAGPGSGPNLEELFERADRNKDGKLSKDELPERLRERLAPLFEKTGKEEITKEELARFSMRAKAGAGAAAGAGGGKMLTAEMFKRIDKDGDGKIVLSDVPEPGRKIAERIYKALNKSPDEPLTEEEFLQAAQKMRERMEEGAPVGGGKGKKPAGFAPPEMKGPVGRFGGGLFGKLDTDKDGHISKAELSKLGSLFDELDIDKDGQLSPRELMPIPPGMEGERPTASTRPKKKQAE